MIIKNRDELVTTALREHALELVEAGIERVLPGSIMKSAVQFDNLKKILTVQDTCYSLDGGRIFVIGGGKAANRMASALEEIVGSENIVAGIVISKGVDSTTGKIKVYTASHPIPDERGLQAVQQILLLKQNYSIDRNDLIVCLVSGGASALMPCPVDGLSLEDKQATTGLLLGCGADIEEMNVVRKHLSRIKGGGLGQFFSPATVVSLVISDVVGDDFSVIASGPTYPDSSTFQDAWNVLEKYQLSKKVPGSVMAYLQKGLQGIVSETPKRLANCDHYIVGNNRLALEAMAGKAGELGYKPLIVTAEQQGDTSDVAHLRAKEILEGRYFDYDAIIIGGETTPTLPANAGRGGRNQHFAAITMLAMKSHPGDWAVASMGTDGSDYLPEVAGALVDNHSIELAISQGIDVQAYLDRFDSNSLFQKMGGALIITGNTGTNVGDVMLYLLER
jgi:glycerate 2-kinase